MKFRTVPSIFEHSQLFTAGEKELIREFFHTCETAQDHNSLLVRNFPFELRRRSMRLLGEIGTRAPLEAIFGLHNLLIDDLLIRHEMCEAIAAVGSGCLKESMALLERIASDPYPATRIYVARAVGRLAQHHPRQIFDPLTSWAHHPHTGVRVACALIIGRLPLKIPGKILPLLRTLSTDSMSEVRLATLEAIPHILRHGIDGIIPILEKLSRDVRWSIRRQTAATISTLPENYARAGIRLLTPLLYDGIPQVSEQGAQALRTLSARNPRRGLGLIRSLARDQEMITPEALGILVRSLRQLRNRHGSNVSSILRLLAAGPDAQVRHIARYGLQNPDHGDHRTAPDFPGQ